VGLLERHLLLLEDVLEGLDSRCYASLAVSWNQRGYRIDFERQKAEWCQHLETYRYFFLFVVHLGFVRHTKYKLTILTRYFWNRWNDGINSIGHNYVQGAGD